MELEINNNLKIINHSKWAGGVRLTARWLLTQHRLSNLEFGTSKGTTKPFFCVTFFMYLCIYLFFWNPNTIRLVGRVVRHVSGGVILPPLVSPDYTEHINILNAPQYWSVPSNAYVLRCQFTRTLKVPSDKEALSHALLLEDYYVFNVHAHVAKRTDCRRSTPLFRGWHRKTSSPWRGSRTLARERAAGPLWRGLRSTTSGLPLLLTLLSCRCWPPFSAAPPASWLVLC